jgi:hypothetical protein
MVAKAASGATTRVRPDVDVVTIAVLTTQRRLLVPVHEGDERGSQSHGIRQQNRLTQHERLADDRRDDGDVHRIADMPVEPPDD